MQWNCPWEEKTKTLLSENHRKNEHTHKKKIATLYMASENEESYSEPYCT